MIADAGESAGLKGQKSPASDAGRDFDQVGG
jgi:hypothetical protein